MQSDTFHVVAYGNPAESGGAVDVESGGFWGSPHPVWGFMVVAYGIGGGGRGFPSSTPLRPPFLVPTPYRPSTIPHRPPPPKMQLTPIARDLPLHRAPSERSRRPYLTPP